MGAALVACGPGGGADGGIDAGHDGGTEAPCALPPAEEQLAACVPLPDDYRPRDNASAGDAWPACSSDDGTYHRIQQSVSTLSRVEAFEQIAALLWDRAGAPSAQDFLDARVLYAQEQGLDSRVQRREDVHYPPPAAGARCSEAGIPEANPDRCVGPAKLLPVLNDAFARGAQGEAPRVHARRIEAALLWFLYVSALSEVETCTTRPADCDSAWAYYTGGGARPSPAGLGAAVQRVAPDTHDRAYDGVLAVRCWRNLDNESGVATDLATRDRAKAQLDRALLRGLARIARARFAQLSCEVAGEPEAQLAFLRGWLPLLDRAAREVDPGRADALLEEAGRATPGEVDAAGAMAALEALFPCP